MPKDFAERFWRVGRLLLLLFVLGAAAFLSAITAMRFAIQGRTVRMPSVVGSTFPKARAALQTSKLGVVVADHVYSSLPVDSVVRQSPPPGTEVKLGQQAQVVLSLGQQKARVPNLVDHSLPAARLQLLTAGLQLGEVSYLYSAGEPSGLILQQDPLPGESGVSSPRVSVLVSLGPRPPAYVMPDLKGESLAQAQALLKAADLQTPQVLQPSGAGGAASVVAQNPGPGARVDQTTPISLTVGALAAPGSADLTQKPASDSAALYARIPGRQR